VERPSGAVPSASDGTPPGINSVDPSAPAVTRMLARMPPFVIRPPDAERPESPEALFRSLRPRDRTVRDLLLRQGDALRAYTQLSGSETDVAIELTTGGGKTLVGLLIAEWRRRSLGQRVAYLCPTVQLARQVASKAEDYGLDVVTLVRGQASWEGDFTRFQRAQAIAVTGYHQVFNSNPRLDSAQTLILDDAHAAEDTVASNWSIDAQRGDPLTGSLFTALAALFAPHIPDGLASRIASSEAGAYDQGGVALVPPEALISLAGEVEAALSEYATERDDGNTFSKTMIGSAVGRCMAFVSETRVLIRPLIAPTSEHSAFAGAEQRIYMSATLGIGGELQRAFGVPRITSISQPDDDQGFGRRFFVMPHASQPAPDDIARQAIIEAGRAVVIAPSLREADKAAASLVPDGTAVVRADQVETNFDAFVDTPNAVLLLANRYDGIDLPDDACRLLILSGLPAHAHLQERFIMDTLGARRVLSERIRTRIQQGAGRATRNARDFTAVIIRSEPLTDFLARDEELRAMPPQLQAEIDFGFDNSESAGTDLMGLLRTFWAQDADWQGAEQALQAQTATRTRLQDDVSRALSASAEKEVLCWRAVFNDDLPQAITLAQEVTDRLIGGDELRPYRALWFYLAASWAWKLARADSVTWLAPARALQHEANGCATPLRWTPRWIAEPVIPATDSGADARASRAASTLRDLGIRGSRFESALAETVHNLGQDEASRFEEGLKSLGQMLGFESVRPNGQADPDSAWRDGDLLWLLFEAKTEERPDTPLSAATVRQALTHSEWVENVLGWEVPVSSLTMIVSPKTSVDAAAIPISGDMRWCTPSTIRAIAARAADSLRQSRAAARGLTDAELESAVSRAFSDHQLDTEHLIQEIGGRLARDG